MILKEKLNKIKGESPIYDESYGRKAFKATGQLDIIKGIVEIIKNGVDAYIEEKDDNLNECHKEKIKIILNSIRRTITIINFAEGMPIEVFETALKIGGDTGSEKEKKTGAHGYGMKEAAWAFENAIITSINKEKYSSRIFWWDEKDNPKYDWDIDYKNNLLKNVSVNSRIREETKIIKEGTFFEGKVPENIPFPNFDALWGTLNDHILLRKINQSDSFEINFAYMDKNKRTVSRQLKYRPPETLSFEEGSVPLKSGEFSFHYPKYSVINCHYKIHLAKHELNSSGENREAGLLICAGPISVLDCTLFNQGGKIANRFFGEIILDGPLRKISKEQRIIDDKRVVGLIKNTPLYENLEKNLGPILEKLIEKERKRLTKSFRDVQEGILEKKEKLLKALNKIAKDIEKEEIDIIGDDKFDPGEDGIRFCIVEDSYLKIFENQNKNLHIVVDTSKISSDSEIIIKSKDKQDIKIVPNKFLVKNMDPVDNSILKKKINFSPSKTEEYQVTAYVGGMLNKAELDIDVVEDERLHIKNSIEFIPSEQDIVSRKSKNFSLIIDFSKINKNSELKLIYDKIFEIDKKKIKLEKAKKIKDKIYELEIKIFCSGKPKENGKVKVSIDNVETELHLNVISSRDKHLKGPFEQIEEDPDKDPSELGYYNPDNKTIYISINHPILKHYLPDTNISYRILYADVIVREACKALARKNVKLFLNSGAEDYRVKFDRKFDEYYKKHSSSLHKFCIDPANLELLKNKNET